MKPIPYGKQNITEEDVAAVVDALKSDYLTQGPKVSEFEKVFAAYVGAKYAVAVNNATAGLHIAAKGLGVSSGKRVIVTPITFASSANCVRFCNGDVVFSDIDKDTYLLDIKKVETLIKSKPKGYFCGIISVDFAGYPVNTEKLRNIADEYGMWILEDACHAPGGYYIDSKGNKEYCGSCNYTDAAVFSFHPVKHIATGEGGMITTNNEELYKKLLLFRTHGITKDPTLMSKHDGEWYYEMIELGYNYRITDIQAALGISQLKRADEGIKRRHEIAEKYNKAFCNIKGITIPFLEKGVSHAYHLYIIQVENRIGLYNFLKKNQIHTQVHYIPLHHMPYYQQFKNESGNLPIAETYYNHCLSLPMFPILTDEEQNYIINKVIEFVK